MNIDELKNNFLKYLIDYRGRTQNTKNAYNFDLSKFISYLRTKDINQAEMVTTRVIEDYLASLGCSTVTKARVRSSISSFFSYLTRKEYIGKNPANNLESMNLPETNPEYLSKEEYTLLLEAVKKASDYYRERDLMLVRLFIKTGLRRAEVVSLNVNNIDLANRTLKVKRKGNREAELHINDELAADFQSYLNTINRMGDEPLFMSKKGNRLAATTVWHLIKHYAKEAGLSKAITVHSLRHTYGTALNSKRFSVPLIQKLMGHKSSQTTFRYVHVQNNEVNEAVDGITFEERG